MQTAFYYHTSQRYEILAPNIYLDWEFNEADLLGVRKSGYIDEIEIKRSRADFLADFKKTVQIKLGEKPQISNNFRRTKQKLKHDALKCGETNCNYFSFLIPEELVDKCEIPEYAGLYVYKIDRFGDGRVHEVKRAKLLHKRKISENNKYSIGRKMAYRFWNVVNK